MIGNDIVDLGPYNSNPRSSNPRFLKKVLTLKEWNQRPLGCTPEQYLWCLWSAKESIYKIIRRTSKTPFKPKQIDCNPACISAVGKAWTLSFTIHFQSSTFYSKSYVSPTHIHTIACDSPKNLEKAIFSTFPIQTTRAQSQSSWVRQKLLERLYLEDYPIPKSPHFKKDAYGVPFLQDHPILFSLSHHERWGAFAFLP